MNSKSVLSKIVALLSREEAKMTYARLGDGTIVESPTFDVGEPIEVVTEDGKSPAPDGEHSLTLNDTEGDEVNIRVITKDGIIVERENVEELEDEDKDKKDMKMTEEEEEIQEMVAGLIDALTPDEVSSDKAEDIAEKVLEALEDKIEILKKIKATKLNLISADAETIEVEPLPGEPEYEEMKVKMADYGKKMEDMAYRIEEMEKAISEMKKIDMEDEDEEEDEEKMSPRNGAPMEMSKVNITKTSKNDKIASAQASFLSKLYK